MKRVVCSIAVIVLAGLALTGLAESNKPPSTDAVEFAQQTSDLLLATLVAALGQEFNETTVANVEQGKHSIGLIFDNNNPNMRLVGTFSPLDDNNRPQDSFENEAL